MGLAACVAVLTAGSVSAQPADPPLGFADGHWQGSVHWQAKLTGDGLVAEGLAQGSFEVQWSGGSPTGALVGTGSGSSIVNGGEGVAALLVDMSATFGGTPNQPLLVGEQLLISGSATVQGIDIPVEFALGPGDMGTIPLDVRAASCTTISGDFDSHLDSVSGELAGVGVLSAPIAFWTAVRTGDGTALSSDQLATMNSLLAEADAFEQAVAAGSFDGEALLNLLSRAEQFSYSLTRGADCGRPPGTYAHVLSGMISRILQAMFDASGGFEPEHWQYVALAAAASGVIGPGSGELGAGYVAQMVPILEALLDVESAAGNFGGVYVIMLTAQTIGDTDLTADALAKYQELDK